MVFELRFRNWLEAQVKPSLLGVLDRELGIDPKQFLGPRLWVGDLSIGNRRIPGGMYQIIKYNYDNDGNVISAVVRLSDIKGVKNRQYRSTKKGMKPTDSEANKPFVVSIEDLDKLMTQGMGAGGDTGMGMGF